MDTSLQGNSLQPNGGNLQNGQSNLQPQSNGTQSTGSLQQDVLGPQAYRNFDGLTVQGTSPQLQQSVTAGRGTVEIFVVLLVLLAIAAAIVFRRYLQTRKSVSEAAVDESTKNVTLASIEPPIIETKKVLEDTKKKAKKVANTSSRKPKKKQRSSSSRKKR